MTNGQIAYEANRKAYQHLNGVGLIEWDEVPPDYKDMWETVAQAVLAAQWKSASEVPDHDGWILVQYIDDEPEVMRFRADMGMWQDRNGNWYSTSYIKRWRELPPMPEG